MTNRRRVWTNADTNRARQLWASRSDNETFLREIGRSRSAVYDRLRQVCAPELAARSRRKATGQKTIGKLFIPDEVVRDAAVRMAADRSLTASFFGDPPPGYSALDRRQAEASI